MLYRGDGSDSGRTTAVSLSLPRFQATTVKNWNLKGIIEVFNKSGGASGTSRAELPGVMRPATTLKTELSKRLKSSRQKKLVCLSTNIVINNTVCVCVFPYMVRPPSMPPSESQPLLRTPVTHFLNCFCNPQNTHTSLGFTHRFKDKDLKWTNILWEESNIINSTKEPEDTGINKATTSCERRYNDQLNHTPPSPPECFVDKRSFTLN